MKVDLSEHKGLMRQISEELVIETYGEWETIFVKCEFHVKLSDKWIPTLYRIGIRKKQ